MFDVPHVGARVVFLLTLAGCGATYEGAVMAAPLGHMGFVAESEWSLPSSRGRRILRVEEDDCDAKHSFVLEVSPECVLKATWLGFPDSFAETPSVRLGAAWFEAGATCKLESDSGDTVVIQIEQGQVVTGEHLQGTIEGVLVKPHGADPIGARMSVRIVGTYQDAGPQKSRPQACAETRR